MKTEKQFSAFGQIFRSAKLYGADQIIRAYLGLPDNHVLPLTIPHGVDLYVNRTDLDLHSPEPLYLATREDIADRVSAHKQTLLFPHPWLMMMPRAESSSPSGTLFIAPPPSERGFEQMLMAIEAGKYPRPWGILLKDRGLTKADEEWWRANGIATHTAGSIHEAQFYYKLREAMAPYALIASPIMSSAVVFAVAMGRRAVAIPDVHFELIDLATARDDLILDDDDGKIRQTWLNLLSDDPVIARAEALDLLGHRYLAEGEVLRRRYLSALDGLDRQVHLHPLSPGTLHRIVAKLVKLGVPAHRLFPSPLAKIISRLQIIFKRDRLAVIRGSDFAHYGVAGESGAIDVILVPRHKMGSETRPGHAIRSPATPSAG